MSNRNRDIFDAFLRDARRGKDKSELPPDDPRLQLQREFPGCYDPVDPLEMPAAEAAAVLAINRGFQRRFQEEREHASQKTTGGAEC